MKTVLLLLAAVTWAAATWSPAKVFSPNREYRYEYESQILTGIPTLNSQYSGLKLKARVIMHVGADNFVTMKLTGIEAFTVTDEPGVKPTKWLPDSQLEPLPTSHSTEIAQSLVQPIKFRYETGLVTKVYAMTSDPYWSVNIKRGILSIINLDLNAANPVSVEASSSKSFMNMIQPDYNVMTSKSAYTVIEPSVMGDCETIYSLTPISSESKLIVSKVINTKSCSPKVMSLTGLLPNVMPPKDLTGAKSPAIACDYVLSGSRHEFLIETATMTGTYTVAAADDSLSKTTVNTYTIQKLTYIKDEPIESPITFDSTPVPMKKGLHAYLPLQALATKEVFSTYKMDEGSLEAAKITMVGELLDAIVEKSSVKVGKDVAATVSALRLILRGLSKPEIVEIIQTLFSTNAVGSKATIAKKQTILVELLATLPHAETPVILAEMVKRNYISSDLYGSILINAATLVVPPSPALVNNLVQLAKDSTIKSKVMSYRAILLGAGLVANKLVTLQYEMGIPATQTSAMLKGFVKELKSMLETSDLKEKITVIKAIGNTGILEFIPDLERLIKDESASTAICKEAIYATRKFSHLAPTTVQSLLLPVYLDLKATVDSRIAALKVIFESQPSFAVVKVIGHSLNYESNPQVASLTYTFLQNIARTSIPQNKAIKSIVKRVLMSVNPVIAGPLLSSNAYRWESAAVPEVVSMGMMTHLGVERLHKAGRGLPHSIIAKQNLHFFGKSFNLWEGETQFVGLDQVIRKLVGHDGILSDVLSGRVNIAEVFESLSVSDLGQVGDEVREILSKTEIPTPIADVFKFYSNLAAFNHEFMYVHWTKNDIVAGLEAAQPAVLKWAERLIAGQEIDIVKAIPLTTNAIVIPTPVGLPLCINLTLTSVAAVKGFVKLSGIHSLMDLLRNPSKLEIEAKLRTSMYMSVDQTFTVQHDILKVGAGIKAHIHADIPTAVKLTLDRNAEKITLKFDIPKEVSSSVSAAVKPSLIKHFVPLRASSYVASLYDAHILRRTPIICDVLTKPMPLAVEAVIPVLRLKAKVHGSISYPVAPVVDYYRTTYSNQEAAIVFEPTSSTPEAVVLEVAYGKRKAAATRAPSKSIWNGWFGNEEAPLIDESPVRDASEFIKVEPKASILNPTEKQLALTVKTVGGYDDAMIRSQLTYFHDQFYLINQFDCQIVGTSIVSRVWKARMESVVKVSKWMETIIEAPKTPSGSLAEMTLWFGAESFDENRVTLRTSALSDKTSVLEPFFGSSTMANTMKTVDLKVVADTSLVSSAVKHAVAPFVMSVAKYPYFMRIVAPFIHKTIPASGTPSTLEAIVQIIPKIYKINAVLSCPSAKVVLTEIPIPKIAPFTQFIVPDGVDLLDLPTFPMMTSLTKTPKDVASALYHVCKVEPRNITTLDNITLPLPEIDAGCEVVLAHDCSPQKLYTVVSSPISPDGVRNVKILFPNFKVEVSQGLVHQGVVVKVNGAVTPISSSRPLIISKPLSGKEVVVLNITSAGMKYIIKAPEIGLVVVTDGPVVEVKTWPMLRSAACGLCSHMPSTPIPRSINVVPTLPKIYSLASQLPKYTIKSSHCHLAPLTPTWN